MNREQMIEKAFYAIWSGCEGSRAQSEMEARNVVDAILPQVTTVEELEAQRTPAILRADDGQVWQRTPNGWDCLSEDGTAGAYPSAKIATPATVLWRPEEVTS